MLDSTGFVGAVSERRLTACRSFARNILDLSSALKNMAFFVNKYFTAIGGDAKNAVHQHT
jgi:hypothetical protein